MTREEEEAVRRLREVMAPYAAFGPQAPSDVTRLDTGAALLRENLRQPADRPCPECGGEGVAEIGPDAYRCRVCHGTGRVPNTSP